LEADDFFTLRRWLAARYDHASGMNTGPFWYQGDNSELGRTWEVQTLKLIELNAPE